MNALRAYRALLRLYPRDYRLRFAAEMATSFASTDRAASRQMDEFVSLLIGAGREWIAKLTTDPAVRGRCLPDVRRMRPPGVPREVWFARPGAGENVK